MLKFSQWSPLFIGQNTFQERLVPLKVPVFQIQHPVTNTWFNVPHYHISLFLKIRKKKKSSDKLEQAENQQQVHKELPNTPQHPFLTALALNPFTTVISMGWHYFELMLFICISQASKIYNSRSTSILLEGRSTNIINNQAKFSKGELCKREDHLLFTGFCSSSS